MIVDAVTVGIFVAGGSALIALCTNGLHRLMEVISDHLFHSIGINIICSTDGIFKFKKDCF